LYADAGRDAAVGMLSAGGPGVGATWTGTHRTPHELLPNAHWRVATASRVGMGAAPPHAVCQLTASTDRVGEVCGRPFRLDPHHHENCQRGAAHMRPHRNLAATLAALIRRAGGTADIERYVPELYDHVGGADDRRVRLAIMDVVAHFPGALVQKWLDVSVRSAHAERYAKAVATPGYAAGIGEKEKRERYGDRVEPIVFEVLGRLGPAGDAAVRALVSAAAAAGTCSPHAVGKWRAGLERAVLYSVADNLLRSIGPAYSPCTAHAPALPAHPEHVAA
jgi:hypothetical protein